MEKPDNKTEQEETVNAAEVMASESQVDSNSVLSMPSSAGAEGTGAQAAQNSSHKSLSFVQTATPVNADALRNAILSEGASASDDPAAGSKKKKKKKRPKSAQTSSSSGSVLSNPATTSGVEGGEAEVVLTTSLEAMSVSDAAAASASTPEAKSKKKKKKKKKDMGESGPSTAGGADLKMEEEASNRMEGSSGGWWKHENTEQAPPQGSQATKMEEDSVGGETEGSEGGREGQASLPNLQRLSQKLLNRQKTKPQQPAPQMMMQPQMQPFPMMLNQMPQQSLIQQQQQQQQQQLLLGQQQMGQQQQGPRQGQRQKPNQGQGQGNRQPQHQQQYHHQHQQQYHQQPQPQHQQQYHHQQQQQQHGQKGKNAGHSKKHHKKNIFEPYWEMEAVSSGLKKGILIEGPIRINAKNYEDAYVPLPDGTADIYISGMPDRNRALNGDVVAVLVEDRQNWRVFTEEVHHYEKCNTPLKTERATAAEVEIADENSKKAAEKEKEVKGEKMDVDVLVEEEEEVELDESGKPVEGTQVTRQVTGRDATPIQVAASAQQEGAEGSAGCRGADSKDAKGASKGQGQGSSAKKRFQSVREVMDNASPVVRKLFDMEGSGGGGEEEGEEGRSFRADKFMQRTGKVVAILRKKHSRASSGNLRPLQDPNHTFVSFAPMDSRVPRMMISVAELPEGFKERPSDFTKILYIARITEWNESSKMPKGTLARSLGEAGQLEPETEALLTENSIDSSDFTSEVLACLPQESPWTIPAKELAWRRDLRRECIFTIDPSTARDLDDALHCTDLGDGVYEVGVHIADVSYFVDEKSELDEVARQRATSVYLVQKVIPMLPRLLCEQLCSLNPDEDRLSFSVIWKITQDGQVLEEWFGRTVIRSCVKLSYEHAQGFIEEPDREWTEEELPPLSAGFTVSDIKNRVLQMDRIAKSLRKARYDGGALRLDQVKIQFALNRESGLPNGYFVYEQRDSNKLVEEFMLLANMAVAHKICTAHREKAVLRRHPPPQSRMVNDLKELCESLGFPIEVETAKDIQVSLARYTGQDEFSQARLQILVSLCSRPMRNAKYFCCGMLPDEALYSHYALNVPLYTHFTSPIRRYPDILVHRTLAAALGYCEVTDRNASLLHEIAEHCNDMKTNAKTCSDKSNELYFAVYVKEAGPLEVKGMVMQVLDKSFDVFILKLGVVKRVYCERLPLEKYSHHKEGKRVELTLMWKPDDGCPRVVTQKLVIFSSVNCLLQSEPEPLKWSAFIRRPVEGDPTIVR